MVGAHGCVGKSIFSIYDDHLRIPLLVRFPGRIKPGTVVRDAKTHDVAETVQLGPEIARCPSQSGNVTIHSVKNVR